MDGNRRLPFDDEPPAAVDPIVRRDEAARARAVDPSRNVVLEASAGTGKTTVLVTRYLNLLKAGVAPTNILAITFTRKAAAEMRQRVVHELRRAAMLSSSDAARWHDLRDRLGDITISTIDAFCLSLLHEFPLEADLDPGFDISDEALVAQIKDAALDRAIAICRRVAARDADVGLVFSQLGESKLRRGLEDLLDRRLVVRRLLRRFTRGSPSSADQVCRVAGEHLAAAFTGAPEGLEAFLADGPTAHPAYALVAADLATLAADGPPADAARFRAALDGVRDYFLTKDREPRKKMAGAYTAAMCPSPEAHRRHVRALAALATDVARVSAAFERDLNRVVARGVGRAFAIACHQYERQLQAHAGLDFPELLARTLALLARMDEFSQSRYRLEARYHHVLVDEFQDTSPAQWRLVSLLVKSWGEGAGLAHDDLPPSIFVVGDRKQSIYGFRDADATILGRARRDIEALRPQGRVRGAISRSYRSGPALLAFANDLFGAMETSGRRDRFRFGRRDAFPVGEVPAGDARVGLVVGDGLETCATGVAAEVDRLLHNGEPVRDPRTGLSRPVAAGDIAVLFRSREGHQAYERALARAGIPSYVYKGLGFFDADETKDVLALLEFLAHPESDLAASALLRSRVVRLSDPALQRLAPRLAAALTSADPPAGADLDAEDARVLDDARAAVAAWLPLVDRVTPAELLDRALAESAYAYELRGPRRAQARENLKKMRALVRKIQNRGYATLAGVAAHLHTLSAGDESNAVVDAVRAVNLMTVHAAKGLEFPIVFLVNVHRGTSGGRAPIRVIRHEGDGSVSIGDFTSDADAETGAREDEETRRLLYVAVTRARDRLYFSMPFEHGRFRPRPGSLGIVLPASFKALLASEYLDGRDTVEWIGASGRPHALRVCTSPREPGADRASSGAGAGQATPEPMTPPPGDAFGSIASGATERRAVTSVALAAAAGLEPAEAPGFGGPFEQPLLGLLVHRLLEDLPGPVGGDRDDLVGRAQALLAAAERAAGGEDACARIVETAVDACLAIREHPQVTPLLATGRWLHEVPFSLRRDGAILRGVVDSIVEHDAGVTVVEFKTGRARPEHERQLDIYRDAAARLFPGRAIEAVLVYAGPRPILT
jgi:ATP-dependent helicase/nuclease subunit A